MSNNAKRAIELGTQHPYDARDDEELNDNEPPTAAPDWALAATHGILWDLRGRGGIGNALDEVDADIRAEITQTLADIIRTAHAAA